MASDTDNIIDVVEKDVIDFENGEAKKKRSRWWKYFDEKIVDGEAFAICKLCVNNPRKYKTSGKANSSTGNMQKHMLRHHRDKLTESDARWIENEKGVFFFSQQIFRKALLKWIILCDQPFTAAEEKPFVDLVQTLNPEATTYYDSTVKSDTMSSYKQKFVELKAELAKVPGKISITLDGWSSKNVIPFMAIRGHWLDENWEYQTKMFDFAHVVGDHDGKNHSIILEASLSRLGIKFSKILGITLDNAGCNNTLFEYLIKYGLSEEEHHVRCLAHILNLSVQDILAMLKVPESIDEEDECDLDSEVLADIDLNEAIDEDDEEVDEPIEEDEEPNFIGRRTIVTLRTLVKKSVNRLNCDKN